MSEAILILHQRSTRSEGLALVATAAIGCVFPLAVCYVFYLFGEKSVWFHGMICLFGVGIAAIGIILGWMNYRANDYFECVVTLTRIRCTSPVSGFGNSFDLPILQIVRIERENSGESYRYYLHDAEGNRYWLTGNYGNPVRWILDTLLEVNPNIENDLP